MPSSRARSARFMYVVALAGVLACSADDDDDLDESFDDWCDASPCGWTKDRGAIEPVRTWHRKDLAVSFLSTPTEISRLIPGAPAACFLVEAVADVELQAQLSLRINFNEDSVVDYDQQFVAVSWQRTSFVINAPISYSQTRVILRKDGVGRAVLAALRIAALPSCSGQPGLLYDGSRCELDEVCMSGRCSASTCSAANASGELP